MNNGKNELKKKERKYRKMKKLENKHYFRETFKSRQPFFI